jgi:hypothetical protein
MIQFHRERIARGRDEQDAGQERAKSVGQAPTLAPILYNLKLFIYKNTCYGCIYLWGH